MPRDCSNTLHKLWYEKVTGWPDPAPSLWLRSAVKQQLKLCWALESKCNIFLYYWPGHFCSRPESQDTPERQPVQK